MNLPSSIGIRQSSIGNDFVGHTTCVQCGKMFEIRVPYPLKAIYVLELIDKLGGRCKECLAKQNPPSEICDLKSAITTKEE